MRTVEQGLVAVGLENAAGASRWLEVVLPAGISFYTFQTLSYIVDVWRGQAPAERNFVRFAGFVSFFPHLVAGPLTRHHQLIPRLARIAATGIDPRWAAGVLLFSVGLAKKVLIADRLGNLVDPMLGRERRARPARARGSRSSATRFQIYFDFSGYSDMAIGLGRLFGIELPQNFNEPVQGGVAQRLLAALAHDALVLAPRLPLHPARRQPLLARAPALQPDGHHGARRALARRAAGRSPPGGRGTALLLVAAPVACPPGTDGSRRSGSGTSPSCS